MNNIEFNLFPGAAHHCITLSYDDGIHQDIRLADILRACGLKATFHLNSGRFGSSFDVGNIIDPDKIKEIYAGHEVSCHMVSHPFPTDTPDISVLEEIIEDRRALERKCGYVVRGMSYPYGNYDDRVISLLRSAGMEYSRTTQSTNGFGLPQDFMLWHPTCHHNGGIIEKLEPFYAPDRFRRMKLLYIWGHSFEFDGAGNWNLIEEFSEKASRRPDTWYATNIEIVDYINALRALRVSVDRDIVYNPSAIEVFFTINDREVSVLPQETLIL